MFTVPVARTETGEAVPSSAVSSINLAARDEAGGQTSPLPLAERLARLIRRRWMALAAAALLIAIGAGTWFWRQPAGLPLPDRPSIAVLPFVNASADPQQDYFSDGITEDLITRLSNFGQLFVIARGSAFRYKGPEIDAAQIGRELGVRYLLRGSVRRDAEHLRITAQLIDAGSGKQLWGEHYERDPGLIFAVRDDVTHNIVVTLVARIENSEIQRALRKPPESLAAYDNSLRGHALIKNILLQREGRGETIAAARALFEQAIAADPRHSPAWRGLAITHVHAWYNPTPGHPIDREFRQQATLDRAAELAHKAVEVDPASAEARATLGSTLMYQHGPQAGLVEFERAFALNPNFVHSRFADALLYSGRASEGIDYLKRIMRLDPFYPSLYLFSLGKAYFFLGRYQEAIELFRPGRVHLPGHRSVQMYLAATAAHLGYGEEARAAVAELLRLDPDYKIGFLLSILHIPRQEDSDRLAAGLRKAGVPD
jgi:TolB-like protein/tetratricopeptide (TPR) repeat protein